MSQSAENDATLECGHPWHPRWRVPGQTFGWCETCEAHKRVIPPAMPAESEKP